MKGIIGAIGLVGFILICITTGVAFWGLVVWALIKFVFGS